MTTFKKLLVVCCLWGLQGCGDNHEGLKDAKMAQTTANVRAPLNLGGRAYVLQEGARVASFKQIDESGNARFELKNFQGDFVVEVSGGDYLDPLTGRTISMRGEAMHGYARDVVPLQNVDIVVTPWSELLYRYRRKHPEVSSVQMAEEALRRALGCGDRDIARAFPVTPTELSPLIHPGDAEMAYVHLGAWAQLAQMVSLEINRKDGVTIAHLVRALGDTIDRRGSLRGDIEVMPGKFIASDLLRQRYAQAMHKFLESKPKNIGLGSDTLRSYLECVSESPADMWGPAGEKLDTDGPSVVVSTPSNNSMVVGDGEIRCEATGRSPIESMELRLTHEGRDVVGSAAPEPLMAGLGTLKATLFARLNARHLSRGALDIVCEARDKWGQARRNAVTQVHINPSGGIARVLIDAEAQRLQGSVKITCECEDAYLQKCALITPSAADGVTPLGTEITRPSYLWDTTKVLDGNKVIKCGNWSRGLDAPQEGYLNATVDNVNPGHIKGTVSLDTPVQGATVQAYAYDETSPDRPRGRPVSAASLSGAEGKFTLAMTDDYAGPVIIEVNSSGTGHDAFYQDLASNQERMPFAPHSLTLLMADYRPGQSMADLSINVATTLAEAYATGQLLCGSSDGLDVLVADGRNFLARHVKAEGLDITTTPVANFTKPINTQSRDAILMGLFHVGISREAMEIGNRHRLPTGIFGALRLVDSLRIDLNNGKLDGLGGDEEGVRMDGIHGEVLDPEALRWSLASAIHHWLNNNGVKTLGAGPNLTSLNHLDFVKEGQLLQVLSRDNSALFGSRNGQYFDQDGPILTVRLMDASGAELDFGRWMRGIVYLHVQARDVSGIQDVKVSIGGNLLKPQASGIPEDALYPIDTTAFNGGNAGTLKLHVEATDRRRNRSTLPKPLQIHYDNVPPNVQFEKMTLWTGSQDITVKGRFSKAIAEGSVQLDGVEIAKIPATSEDSATDFAVPMHLPDCDARYQVDVVAEGVAGNVARGHMTVFCKKTPPELAMLPSPFKRAKRGDLDDTLVPSTTKTQAGSAQIDAVGVKTIEQLVTDLDESTHDKQPELRFAISDKVQDGFGTSRLPPMRVLYEYSYMGQDGVERVTAARPAVRAPGKDYYAVRISYQSLLPDDILKAPVDAARQMNFIGKSVKTDRHTIVVRAIDSVGNETRFRYPFNLHLYAPAVTARCTATPEVEKSTTHLWGLPVYWEGGKTPFVVKFYHAYGVDWGDSKNLVPKNGEVSFQIHESTIRWNIYSMVSERYETTYRNNNSYQRARIESDVKVTPGDASRPTAVAEFVADKGSAFLDFLQVDPHVVRLVPGGGLRARRESEQQEYSLNTFQASLLAVPITMKGVGDGGHEPVAFHLDRSCNEESDSPYPLGLRIYWDQSVKWGHPRLSVAGTEAPFVPFDPF